MKEFEFSLYIELIYDMYIKPISKLKVQLEKINYIGRYIEMNYLDYILDDIANISQYAQNYMTLFLMYE